MSKHTPGPWTCCINKSRTAYLIKDENGRIIATPSWHSCDDTHYPLQAQSEANSKLMAAAPELLEALKRIGDPEFRYASDDDEDTQLSMRIADARAAIAKATGAQS